MRTATGQYYMPEVMGSGAALLDYDNDGVGYDTEADPYELNNLAAKPAMKQTLERMTREAETLAGRDWNGRGQLHSGQRDQRAGDVAGRHFRPADD